MLKTIHFRFVLACLCAILFLYACVNNTTSDIIFTSSGGIKNNKRTCITCANDVIVSLESLAPKPQIGEPKMSMQGIMDFVEANNISTITALLNKPPSSLSKQLFFSRTY